MVCEIPLGRGYVSLVDAQDFERVSAHSWHALRAADGAVKYARSSIKEVGAARHRSVLMHRFILRAEPDCIVDHINGDGLDNRRSNLRFANASESARNTAPRGVTRLNGVRRLGPSKFLASIAPNGMEIYLGNYETPEQAAAVYNAAALIAYGAFARLNPGGSSPDVLANVLAEKRRSAERLLSEIAQLTRGSQ